MTWNTMNNGLIHEDLNDTVEAYIQMFHKVGLYLFDVFYLNIRYQYIVIYLCIPSYYCMLHVCYQGFCYESSVDTTGP